MSFIIDHMDEIVAEWESFARVVSPASATMDQVALRDHVRQMLEAIAKDVQTRQSSGQQELKSKGLAPDDSALETAAESHGLLRHMVGFDLTELVAEFRALRASVLRLWVARNKFEDPATAYEITRFNEAIDQALAESVDTYSTELAKSRDTFLAILGHELNTPLEAIHSAFGVLSDPARAAAHPEARTAGRRSVAAMGAVVKDLLEYTRTRLGKGIPVTLAATNLEEVCKECIAQMSLIYPAIEFRFEAGPGLHGVFDAARMRQVISNLLGNAVQHGRRGAAVFLVASSDNYNLSITVTNQGRPIPEELLQVIFDPLVQIPADESDPSQLKSLGLGLFIAREIVLAHGGTIRATSTLEAGTAVTVELPCATHAALEDAPGAPLPKSRAVAY